ncbi:MAG: transposase [Chloroflexi bacterium]|nr:transposase [Chloroflexota bacterium]MBU1750143.1 transposase [Chloroflexota bacterium]
MNINAIALGASVHDSGQTHQTGHITKQGRKDLRWALVQAAWTAVNHDPHWHTQFERLAARPGKPKAIVAIARKLLVVVWQVLTQRAADRHADPDRVARKLMVWSDSLTPDHRGAVRARPTHSPGPRGRVAPHRAGSTAPADHPRRGRPGPAPRTAPSGLTRQRPHNPLLLLLLPTLTAVSGG